MSITGSCLCGSVRYEISGSLKAAGNCHCSMCRKASGAAYVTWGHLDPAHFRWTAGEDVVARYRSSPAGERLFCARCGSTLAAAAEGRIGEIVLGSVDGDPGVRPSEHIFVGSKAVWHEIVDELPQFNAWPPGFDAPAD